MESKAFVEEMIMILKIKPFLREKEICDKIVAKRSNETNTLNDKIRLDKLTYHFKNEDGTSISFNGFHRPLGFVRKIKDGFIDLEKTKENKEKIKSNLMERIAAKWEHKSEKQKNNINNLEIFYKAKEKVIKLFDHYTTIISNAKYEAKKGNGLTILSLKITNRFCKSKSR